MPIVADACAQLATGVGNVFTLGASVARSLTIEEGLAFAINANQSTTTGINGKEGLYRIEYPDTSSDGDFEVCDMTYSTAGTLTRTTTYFGSNGNSAVTFSGTVVIRSVLYTPHIAPVVEEDDRILQCGVDNTSANPVANTTSTYAALFDSISIVPVSSASVLIATMEAGVSFTRTSSGTGMYGDVAFTYYDSGGTATTTGNRINLGNANLPADADMDARHSGTRTVELTQSHLNGSGNWELVASGKRISGDTTVLGDNQSFAYFEILRA